MRNQHRPSQARRKRIRAGRRHHRPLRRHHGMRNHRRRRQLRRLQMHQRRPHRLPARKAGLGHRDRSRRAVLKLSPRSQRIRIHIAVGRCRRPSAPGSHCGCTDCSRSRGSGTACSSDTTAHTARSVPAGTTPPRHCPGAQIPPAQAHIPDGQPAVPVPIPNARRRSPSVRSGMAQSPRARPQSTSIPTAQPTSSAHSNKAANPSERLPGTTPSRSPLPAASFHTVAAQRHPPCPRSDSSAPPPRPPHTTWSRWLENESSGSRTCGRATHCPDTGFDSGQPQRLSLADRLLQPVPINLRHAGKTP